MTTDATFSPRDAGRHHIRMQTRGFTISENRIRARSCRRTRWVAGLLPVGLLALCLIVIPIGSGSAAAASLSGCGTICTEWAWGDNYSGELGDGTTTNRTVPLPVAGLTSITAIAAGGSSSYALRSDGTVWAWGDNYFGELGDGTTTNRIVPVQVSGLTNVTAIASSSGYSGYALKSNGTVWAWGLNGDGELGDGTTTDSTVPVQVSGLTGVTAISAGYAVMSDGTVRAWGFNADGQLGDGTTTNRMVPVQVSGLTSVIAVASGGFAGYALRSDGTVRAWGENTFGELGDGTTTNSMVPVQVSALTGVTAIASQGGDEAGHAYALRSDGTVRAWGYNAGGELGDGTTTNRITPVPVSGLTGVTAIAAGAGSGYALMSDRTVRAWGLNFGGQLGDGTTNDSTVPVVVSGLTGVTAIAGGGSSGYAVGAGSSTGAYVALGDSYSSGEGAFHYYPDSDNPATFDTCHRSTRAYSLLLDVDRKLGAMSFAACSGAVTDDLYHTNPLNPNEPAQLDHIGAATKTVTITIGGNDADFVHVISQCVDGPQSPGTFGCSQNARLKRTINNELLGLAGTSSGQIHIGRPIHALSAVYRDIHSRAPKATIYVAGYPRLFGSSQKPFPAYKKAPSGKACIVGTTQYQGPQSLGKKVTLTFRIDYLDALWIDDQGNRLNRLIQAQVASAQSAGVPIQYVSPRLFDGHGLCDTMVSWLHGLEFVGAPTNPTPAPSSFHPTGTGQHEGYELAFLGAIR